MSRKIFLIDDDPVTHAVVKGVLESDMTLVSSYSLSEANSKLETDGLPSLVIIDRMLPDGDGLILCTKMRSEERLREIPIVFLSSKTTETDKVGGLFAGADDYIGKPVSPLELKARIQARLRPMSKKLVFGKLIMDLSSHRTFIQEDSTQKEIDLTRIEFKMLTILVQSPERVFSRELLLSTIWGTGSNLSDRVVDTHMSHLRKKIIGSEVTLVALRGEGYRVSLHSDSKFHAA